MSRAISALRPILGLFFAYRNAGLLLGLLLSLTTAVAGIALLGVSGWFITATAIAGLSAAALNVFVPSAAIRLLAIGRTLSRYGERLTTHDGTLSILSALRERLFLGWSVPWAARSLRYQPSKLLYRLTADIDALESVYLRILAPAFTAIAASLIVAAGLGFLDARLGLAAGAWLIATAVAALLIAGGRAGKHARRRAYGIEAIRSRSIDLVAGQTELLMFGRLQAQTAAIADADRYAAQADDALNRLDTTLIFVFGCCSTLLVAGALLAVSAIAGTGAIGAPAATFGLIAVLSATEQFAPLRRGALEFGRTLLSARRVASRLSAPSADTIFAAPDEGMAVGLHGVTVFHDGSPTPALRDVDLVVEDNEIVALVGASGAGKSSLLGLLAGELTPQSGTVRRIEEALMTQRTELFQDTIRGNLLLANPAAKEDALWEALAAAGLAHDVEALPDGLDTALGEGGGGLSGGQSRRLALARFLLRDRPLWLLDEPTEGLDGPTARDVIGRIARQAQGRAVVLATHLRREAGIADRIIILQGGRIVGTARRGEAAFEAALGRLRPD